VTVAPAVDPAQLWIDVARFAGHNKPRVVLQERRSWAALARWLLDHEEGLDKKAIGLWAPTLYGVQYRKDENVVSIGAAVLDFDHVTPDWSLLEPYEYVGHTSFSHTADDPHWRVILPLVEPIPADQWEEAWGRIHFWLGPTVDDSCSNPSRAYFNPSCPKGATPEAIHHDGRALDWRELPPVPQPDDGVIGTGSDDGTWAVRPGDDYSAKATVTEVIELLEKHGAAVVRECGGITYVRRPGKEDGGHSATVGYKGTNLFYCFSSTWPPFEGNKAYSPFGIYALLGHGGDFRAAAAALRERGFGKVGDGRKDEETAQAAQVLKASAEAAENLSDFKLAVRRFLNNKSSNSQKELLADTLADWGVERGRLLVANEGDAARPVEFLVDDDGRVIELDKDDPLVKYALDDAGVNAGHLMYAWIVNRLKATANRRARRVKLERYVARRDGRIYVSCGPTKIVIAEAGIAGLRTVRNGEDGVLFTADAVLPAWDPSAAPVDPLTLAVFQPTLEPPHEAPEYTPDAQRLLLQATLVAIVGGLRPVPAVVSLGASAGGKTTLARGIVRLLRGSDGDVSTVSGDKRDFDALTTRRPVVAFDNLDGQAPPWFPDAFATAVTGGRSDGRALYTNDDVNSKPKTAALVVSTRTANFAKRPDIVERLLPLFMVRPSQRLPDAELFDGLDEARDGALAWLATMAVEAAACYPQAPQLPGRLVDWERTVWALDPKRGPAALDAMERAQQLSIVDPDELAAAIMAYLREHEVLEGAPTDIVKLVDPQDNLPHFGGGKAIARRLRELAKGFLPKAGVKCEERPYGNGSRWTFVLAATPPRASVSGELEKLEIFQNSEGKLVVEEAVRESVATRESWGVGTEPISTFSISPRGEVSGPEARVAASTNGRDRQPDRDQRAAPPIEANSFVREILQADIVATATRDGRTALADASPSPAPGPHASSVDDGGPYATETDRRRASLRANAPKWAAQADWKTRQRWSPDRAT
jgi:hypothetical protein